MPSRILAPGKANRKGAIKVPLQKIRNFGEEARKERNRKRIRDAKKKPPPNRRADGTFARSKRGKYNNEGRYEDGIWMDSKAEADRYLQLKEMVERGDIDQLEVHPTFKCIVNNQPICTYEADFRYRIKPGRMGQRTLVEDVKGMETREFKLKLRLVHALGLCQVIMLEVKGSIQRYRYLTADQFHTAKDEPDEDRGSNSDGA